MIKKYANLTRVVAAIDCIIFGFDGKEIKLLVIKRAFEPEKNKWSLMGGFIQPDESADTCAAKTLKKLTGLSDVYLEQLHTFSEPRRDPFERVITTAYFALIDSNLYKTQLTDEYQAEWFPLNRIPKLIHDHNKMVLMAKEKLRYKAAMHPILFELLPDMFTLPTLQSLFEAVFETSFDKGNFMRKIISTKLVVRLNEKDKENSRKGAYYYKLDKRHYKTNFNKFLHFMRDPN